MSAKWTARQIPDQTGRIAVVTGANSGIGFVTSLELARARARVVLACRDTKKGDGAARDIVGTVVGADVEVSALDLSSLASVRAFASVLEQSTELSICSLTTPALWPHPEE